LLIILIPLTIYAAEKLQISINNKIHIKVSKPLSSKLIDEHGDDFIKYNGVFVKRGFNPRLSYLEAVDKYYFKKK
jgi:hypothetical protein